MWYNKKHDFRQSAWICWFYMPPQFKYNFNTVAMFQSVAGHIAYVLLSFIYFFYVIRCLKNKEYTPKHTFGTGCVTIRFHFRFICRTDSNAIVDFQILHKWWSFIWWRGLLQQFDFILVYPFCRLSLAKFKIIFTNNKESRVQQKHHPSGIFMQSPICYKLLSSDGDFFVRRSIKNIVTGCYVRLLTQ